MPFSNSRGATANVLGVIFFCCLLVQTAPLAGQTATPERPNLRIIVVDSLTQAQQIVERLKRGDDFGALAKEKSTDPSAGDGGSLGRVDPATLRLELRDALQGVAPGQISAITKISAGYAILKVEAENKAPAPSATTSAAPSASSAIQYMGSAGQDLSASLPGSPAQPLNPASQGMSPTSLALSGRGGLRFPPDVSGAVDFEVAFRNLPKPRGWDQDLKQICELRRKTPAVAEAHFEELLDPLNPDGAQNWAPKDAIQVHSILGDLLGYQGKMDEAIARWQAAYKVAESTIPAMLPQLQETLGTVYLHKSEMENDVYRNPGDRCIFPPLHKTAYAKTDDSKKAIEYFTKYLEQKPDDLEVKWLLNLAYMTLGQYPDGVPPKYRISAAGFESPEQIGRFVDVAAAAGVNLMSLAGGVIVDDFENNGLLDIVTSSSDDCESLHYFHNNGDGTFADRTQQSGLAGQLGGLNLFQADYDDDGCLDILVPRGAWQFPNHLSLLRGNCDGTFTDVTREAGLGNVMSATQSVVWADIDNDGWLDLFVGNEQGQSHLFRNRGDGTFEDISHFAGVDREGMTKGVVAGDYDNDGYVDFYVSNLNGENFLYHNNHNRTFTEVAQQAGVQLPMMSFSTWFFDYDNDGWPDIFVATFPLSLEDALRGYMGLPQNAETLKLYHNLGNGTFKDVTKEVGLDRSYNVMGANFGDIDNDGYLDMYLGTGSPPYGNLLPSVLYRNQEGKHFVNVSAAAGTGELHKGHGVAFADMDNRGYEDILTVIGGAVPGDAHAFRLFENPGNGNDWITVKLVGMKTNRAAIGARIKVTVENEGKGTRSIYRTVGSGGSFGASPLEQHIGLGKAARIVSLEIWWPTSNTRQKFTDVAKNQFIQIVEFEKDYTKLNRPPFHLGGPKRPAVALSK